MLKIIQVSNNIVVPVYKHDSVYTNDAGNYISKKLFRNIAGKYMKCTTSGIKLGIFNHP